MVSRGLNQRQKEDKKPKVIENPKSTLIVTGRKTSHTVREVLTALHKLKAPYSVNLTSQKHDLLPFEEVVDIEKLSRQKDTSLFFLGSNNKKRPNNLTMGRFFDHQLLDMVEFGIENYIPMQKSSVLANRYGSKPCILFKGDVFVNDEKMKLIQNMFLDAFRGEEVKSINLLGLDHVIVITAIDTESVQFSHYAVQYKPSGETTPNVDLIELGPFMDLKVRRTRFASDDLRKKAMQTPDVLKKSVNFNKNITRDALGNVEARIHVEQQEIQEIATKKMSALSKHNIEDVEKQTKSEELGRKMLAQKREYVQKKSNDMDIDE
jgi:ribosome production factor 2